MNHDYFIRRCLQLAINGLGTTYPNPLVGSVIVDKNGKILGEGFHLKSGEPHAEVLAVNNARQRDYDNSDFAESTLYVNLEPCSHQGKTPPCASMIVKNNFKNVVIGTLDPHSKVAGKGVELLKQAGIEVTVGVCQELCNEVNKRFFSYHKKRRPYIILKWAQTEDGFIAPQDKKVAAPIWITNPYTRQLAHKLRAQEQSILVGAQTVVDDNPKLTVRDWAGNHPTRIVLDYRDELSDRFQVFDNAAVTQILKRPVEQVKTIVDDLFFLHIQSVIIEGGARTLQQFISQNYWDEIHLYTGTTTYFKQGLKAPEVPTSASLKDHYDLDNDTVKIFLNK